MSKKLEEKIIDAFDAPEPRRKDEFLQSINYPKATMLGFMLGQAGYMRKRVWAAALAAIVPIVFIALSPMTESVLTFIRLTSSLLPFIALAGITEIARSASHNMAELEMSCKHSFTTVIIIRLGLIGFADMIMFAAIIASLRMFGDMDVVRAGIYMFIPFLLTCALSIFTINRLRSKEGIYVCGGISCGISLINAFISNRNYAAFIDNNTAILTTMLIALLIWTAGEIIKLIRRTEDFQWNLS